MEKIDITSGVGSGDTGPEGGKKINDNFIEVIGALFGVDLWSDAVSENLTDKLNALNTNNKNSFVAAINEIYARGSVINDALDTSLLKTYSIDKIKSLIGEGNGGQFTDDEVIEIRALLFKAATQTLTAVVSQFEKGVATDLYFNWSVDPGKDTIETITLDGNEVASGTINSALLIEDQVATRSVTLFSTFEQGADLTTTVTSYARVPQFYGTLPENYTEPTWNYANLNSYNKVVQGNSTITVTDDFNNVHFFFILNKENPTLKDVSDFPYIIGDFSSNAYFLTKEITITLANGTTTTAWLFVTRETVNAPSTFKSA